MGARDAILTLNTIPGHLGDVVDALKAYRETLPDDPQIKLNFAVLESKMTPALNAALDGLILAVKMLGGAVTVTQ